MAQVLAEWVGFEVAKGQQAWLSPSAWSRVLQPHSRFSPFLACGSRAEAGGGHHWALVFFLPQRIGCKPGEKRLVHSAAAEG